MELLNKPQLQSLAKKLNIINLQARLIISSKRADSLEIFQGYQTAKKRLFTFLYDGLGLTRGEWREIYFSVKN